MKGVAGNLGLRHVFPSAEILERAIRQGDAQVSARVNEFAQVLSRQVKAIQAAMRAVVPDWPVKAKESEGSDVQAPTVAIAHLRTLLESSDGDAAEAFIALERALGTSNRPLLPALGAAISEFDFEGALLKLREIAAECGAKWEPAT